jgi:hypothetical protein
MKEATPVKQIFNLETEIMDYAGDKYNLVVLSAAWAKHLRKREEFRHQPYAAVIKAALAQILSGEVHEEQIIASIEPEAQPQEPVVPVDPVNLPLPSDEEPGAKKRKSSKKEELAAE